MVCKQQLSQPGAQVKRASVEPKTLPRGKYPGFSKLPSKAGVYRCKLWLKTKKKDPAHSDYEGVLHLTGSKAGIRVWVHEDGSLGLRLVKLDDKNKEMAK